MGLCVSKQMCAREERVCVYACVDCYVLGAGGCEWCVWAGGGGFTPVGSSRGQGQGSSEAVHGPVSGELQVWFSLPLRLLRRVLFLQVATVCRWCRWVLCM
jgi:hypothetical protein